MASQIFSPVQSYALPAPAAVYSFDPTSSQLSTGFQIFPAREIARRSSGAGYSSAEIPHRPETGRSLVSSTLRIPPAEIAKKAVSPPWGAGLYIAVSPRRVLPAHFLGKAS